MGDETWIESSVLDIRRLQQPAFDPDARIRVGSALAVVRGLPPDHKAAARILDDAKRLHRFLFGEFLETDAPASRTEDA